jgi:hypothetical protein
MRHFGPRQNNVIYFEEKTNRNGEEGAKGRKEVPLHVSLSAFTSKNSSMFWQVPAFGK